VVDYKLRTGSLQGYPGADAISNEALLELGVAVLFPSALENVITNQNAARIKCGICCELANGPTTPEADEIPVPEQCLRDPRFFWPMPAGWTVSYFEQVQNTYNFYWPLAEVHQRLDEKMTKPSTGVRDVQTGEGEHAAGGLSCFCGAGGRGLQTARLGVKRKETGVRRQESGSGDRRRNSRHGISRRTCCSGKKTNTRI